MYKKVAILLIMCLTLAGCSSKKVDNTTLDNSINDGSISNQIENNQYTKPNIEYAHDNMGNQDIGQYDSGIYSGDVKLSESYDYSGKTFSGESTNQIEDSEQSDYENTNVPVQNNDDSIMPDSIKLELTSLYDELALYIDKNTGEYIINQQPNEDYDQAVVRISIESNKIQERINEIEAEFGKLKEIQDEQIESSTISSSDKADIQSIIIDGVYNNGIFIINTIDSIDEFNENHKISADGVLKLIKTNLEGIEYCNNIIQNTGDKDLISSWRVLKNDLMKWRNNLSKINTIEDYQLANLKISDVEREDLSKFISNLNKLG